MSLPKHRLLVFLLAGSGLPSCTAPADSDLAYLDEAPAIPEGVPVEVEELEDPRVSSPDECGRGTGKTDEGMCVKLPTREIEGHGEQVTIPGGRFILGDIPRRFDGRDARVKPAIRWAGQPLRDAEAASFWIDVVEVSRGMYAACVEAGDCEVATCPGGGEGLPPKLDPSDEQANAIPQTCVSKSQAQSYCEAKGQRLPTAAEWEYAARGVDARLYPWGNVIVDEIPAGVMPVAMRRLDTSYFGVIGMGSAGLEWTSTPFDPHAGWATYLGDANPRAKKDLAAQEMKRWMQQIACVAEGDKECARKRALGERFVVKGSVAGSVTAAFDDEDAAAFEGRTVEDWPFIARDPMIGFRCAADLEDTDTPLTVPKEAPPIPITRQGASVEVFGAVGEALNASQAAAFCGALRVPGEAAEAPAFRLPSEQEVHENADIWLGPGPFWTADGALEQERGAAEPRWLVAEAKPGEPLLARCVR